MVKIKILHFLFGIVWSQIDGWDPNAAFYLYVIIVFISDNIKKGEKWNPFLFVSIFLLFPRCGQRTRPKRSGFLENETQNGSRTDPQTRFLGFKTNSFGSTIPTRLPFSTTIQSATTKNRFRRLSGTARRWDVRSWTRTILRVGSWVCLPCSQWCIHVSSLNPSMVFLELNFHPSGLLQCPGLTLPGAGASIYLNDIFLIPPCPYLQCCLLQPPFLMPPLFHHILIPIMGCFLWDQSLWH